MHGIQDAIMNIFQKSGTPIYQFFALGELILIGVASWMCQECNGTTLLLWNDLQLWKQFQKFYGKMQVFFWFLGAASRLLWLGLASCICMGRIRVRIWVHNPLHWWIQYLISMESFSIFSSWRTCQFAPNLSFFDVHEILRPWWEIILHKKIWKLYFSIFVIFYLIKWINGDKNSNK